MHFFRALWAGIREYDLLLVSTVVVLTLIGVTMVGSATLASFGDVSQAERQLIFVVVGFLTLAIVARLDYRIVSSLAILFYLGTLVLLVLLLVRGETVRGTASWLSFGFLSLQPSEFGKVSLVLLLGSYLARYTEELFLLRHLIITLLLTLIPMILTILEPDWGSALVFLAIWFVMIAASSMPRIRIVAVVGSAIVVAVVAWFTLLAPYQKERILTFLDPSRDPYGASYNVLQSISAVGSGGLFGKGLGRGPQSQLNFLPARHTDFIFAVIAEELGFLGAATVLFLFSLLFVRILLVARHARDSLGWYLTMGVLALIATHTIVNIGMNVGLFPVTGIPLPFISYGGSSLVSTLIALGIVLSIQRKSPKGAMGLAP
ncbi:MAG: rod shape-determining protein RodA [Parcubacteria group bacterium]|nr:rod shape-determining protein RodA [Parcubacteria group bacterium]